MQEYNLFEDHVFVKVYTLTAIEYSKKHPVDIGLIYKKAKSIYEKHEEVAFIVGPAFSLIDFIRENV